MRPGGGLAVTACFVRVCRDGVFPVIRHVIVGKDEHLVVLLVVRRNGVVR